MIHKTKFLTTLVAVFTVLFFNSCSEETELLDPCVLSPCNGSSFQVDFGGETYIATETKATFTTTGIEISGSKSNGESFEIFVDGFTAGTYSSDKVNISYWENIAAEFDYANQSPEDVKNGVVTITSIDAVNKTMTGTFSFTGYYTDDTGAPREPIVFTNGTFTIPYTGTNPNNPNPNPTASFKADFSGQTFTTSMTQAVIAGGAMVIGATKPSGENFQLLIDGTTAGSYNADSVLLSYSPDMTSEFSYANLDNDLNSNGSVIITEVNTINMTISGTFQFVGHWSDSDDPRAPITFTNGSFTVPYTGNTSTDTFFAKVDGVEFVDDLIGTSVASAGGDDFITINAFDVDQNSIVLAFNANVTVGQAYPVGDLVTGSFSASYNRDGVAYTATTGSITLSTLTATKAVGTFQIQVFDAGSSTGFSITEGTFDVEY